MSAGDKAAIVSAIAAAVAAIASSVSVFLSSRWQKRAREPHLAIQLSRELGDGRQPFPVNIRIENDGGGVAQPARFWASIGDRKRACFGGVPPNASLAPGAGVTLKTGLVSTSSSDEAMAVVVCRIRKRVHAWNMLGDHKSWRITKPSLGWAGDADDPLSMDDVIHHFYSEAPSIAEVRAADYRL
jgi:hypothetical protein